MKKLLTSTFLCSLLTLAVSPVQAQEADELSSIVLVGAMSASITNVDVEFANLPSGKVIQVGENGVTVLEPADAPEVDPSVPRVQTSGMEALPEPQRRALARKLENTLDQLMTAYDDEVVSEDDVLSIVKFLLDLELPYDEAFVDGVQERFGPIVDDATVPQPVFEPDADRVTDPADQDATPVEQTTDPIDNNPTYFAPGQ